MQLRADKWIMAFQSFVSMSSKSETLNINVGILGHVDSGKTSLAKALSTTASTAAFDKNPQSKERGITLDLGFSSFEVLVDESLKAFNALSDFAKIQVTLVDCPGHASLIRTVIGGAQIIDMVLLVVDGTKGIQTQTAECLLLAEITCPKNMVVVVNKIDMIPEADRVKALDKLEKRLHKTLQPTKFAEAELVFLSACPGANTDAKPHQLDQLMNVLKRKIQLPDRSPSGPFLFSVDHCFGIRGQGTILTGTVVSGAVSVGETVEIPSLREKKKVKSIQVFRQPVHRVIQGDRCGICVTQLEASQFERGLVSSPESVVTLYAAVVSFTRIPYYKPAIQSKSRFHVSVGHSTVMAKSSFFLSDNDAADFDFGSEFVFADEVQTSPESKAVYFALLEFDHPILCPSGSVYIASRLDTDIHSNSCRLAFHGKLLHGFREKHYAQKGLPSIRAYKKKEKWGTVDRMTDEYTKTNISPNLGTEENGGVFQVIVHSLFKKETNIELFRGLKVELSTGESGVIEGSFGQSGKIKVRISLGLKEETQERLEGAGKKKGRPKEPSNQTQSQPLRVKLAYKRYVYGVTKTMVQ